MCRASFCVMRRRSFLFFLRSCASSAVWQASNKGILGAAAGSCPKTRALRCVHQVVGCRIRTTFFTNPAVTEKRSLVRPWSEHAYLGVCTCMSNTSPLLSIPSTACLLCLWFITVSGIGFQSLRPPKGRGVLRAQGFKTRAEPHARALRQ